VISTVLFVALGGVLQPPAEDLETARAAEAMELTRRAAADYEISLLSQTPVKLQLEGKPVLQWSNPIAGSVHGNVFIWTHQGRPEVVASLFKWFSPHTHTSHEFCSLSQGKVRASSNLQTWEPARAGVEVKPVPDAPAPAATPIQRLSQMRAMARDFTVDKTDRDQSSRELRLLTQPIYRYQSTAPQLLDGGLFTFVQGTDPEVFLLLEAQRDESGPRWHFALARMNSVQFVARYRDAEVWRAEILPWVQTRNRREPYATIYQQ
jgi:hypothetical protein